MLQTSNSVPLHVQAANYMREKIENREWPEEESPRSSRSWTSWE